jgi:anti-sigma regulatory factor (Ser/Thr protein kinase)
MLMQAQFVVDAVDAPHAATLVLDRFSAFAELAELPVTVRLETHLALDEIVANIARHNGGACPLEIEVRLAFDDQALFVDVLDDGLPFDPVAATTIIRSDVSQLPSGGFGIALTRRFTEQLAYAHENNRNHLSFRKRVPYTRLRRLINEAARDHQPSGL